MELIDISKEYIQGEPVLSNVEYSLDRKQIYGLLGINGAGKSTLIKIIVGLVRASSGKVEEKDASLLSFLPEHPYLPVDMTALQVVSFACRMRGEPDIETARTLLAAVGLKQEAWEKKIRTFSKGMCQRTAIAYCLAGNPGWMILDEPMSGLDAMGRAHILELLKQYHNRGCGLFMCSHIVTDIARLCDHVCIMARGKIRETMPIKEHSMAEAELMEQRLLFWSGNASL
ncbi:MAG: ABC transporter ATP-binding protein [Mariprofundaceae bacterium]|nr:ABC transporter ATP-binding protein [Mariprofundaceae bacterium]